MLLDRSFGDAGARVVIEERLTGRECSMMALCDGERFVLLATAEDHKAVFEGDRGPNTGGMGAYSPSPLVDAALSKRIAQTIFAPTVAAMAAMGRPFRGLLYGGLMLTPDRGPMVIEWNCRFGDPETQAVLPRMEDDLLPWLLAAAKGELPAGSPTWSTSISVCVVLAAAGYPGKVRSGDAIDGLGRRRTACRRRHRSGRVSRRHQARGRALAHQWRPRTGRDRAGRGSQFSASARLQWY